MDFDYLRRTVQDERKKTSFWRKECRRTWANPTNLILARAQFRSLFQIVLLSKTLLLPYCIPKKKSSHNNTTNCCRQQQQQQQQQQSTNPLWDATKIFYTGIHPCPSESIFLKGVEEHGQKTCTVLLLHHRHLRHRP